MPFERRDPDHKMTRAEIQRDYRRRQAAARAQEQQQKGLPPTPAIPTMPSAARWKALAATARTTLETLLDEQQQYYDERSEEWQESERGQSFQANLENVQSALDNLADYE